MKLREYVELLCCLSLIYFWIFSVLSLASGEYDATFWHRAYALIISISSWSLLYLTRVREYKYLIGYKYNGGAGRIFIAVGYKLDTEENIMKVENWLRETYQEIENITIFPPVQRLSK